MSSLPKSPPPETGTQDRQRPGRAISIRKLLLRLAFGYVLPTSIGAVALSGIEYQRRDEQMKASLVATTRALTQALDSQLELGQAIAHTLTTSRNLTERKFAIFHAQATASLEHQRIVARVSVLDRDGNFILNTGQPYGMPLPRPANREQLMEVFDTGKPLVSNVFIGAVALKPVVVLYAPVIENGQVALVVSLEVAGNSLGRILMAEHLPDQWLSSILDASGRIVARTPNPDSFLTEYPQPEVLVEIRKSAEGTFIARTKEGVPSLYAFSRSSRSGWSVNIAVPQALRQKELLHSTLPVAIGLLLIVFASIVMTRRIALRISDAVQGLQVPAMALGTGGHVAEFRSDVREVDDVARAMSLAGRLLEERTQALQEGERRLKLALEAGNSTVWELDVASGHLQGIDEILSRLGRGPEEAATPPAGIAPLTHPDDLEPASALLAKAIEGQSEGYRFEARLLCSTGLWRWFLSQARVAERDRKGRASRIVGTLTDIDARKRAEEEIRRLNAELEQHVRERTAELERANKALQRSNAELQNFAHVTAHDLQTPLRSIAGFSQLVQAKIRQQASGEADRELETWTAQIVENAKRLQILIQSLLSYTRIDKQGFPFKQVNVNQILAEVIGALGSSIEAAGAEVVAEQMPSVQADPVQLGQLFQNLIENAIKYRSNLPPRIRIACTQEGGDWLFSITDNGIGIDPRHHERIFAIFKRLHSYTQVPGSGIGLATCRRIVERHGGRIWVASQPGEGSTFYFTIPVAAYDSTQPLHSHNHSIE